MSNRYSRIFHHISTDDLKRNREITIEKIEKVKKIKEEERSIFEIFKHDWRRELKEGMTSSDVFTTTIAPAEGDGTVTSVNPLDSANYNNLDVNGNPVKMYAHIGQEGGVGDDGVYDSAFVGTVIRDSGSGTGSDGGFDVGGQYLAFQGTGTPNNNARFAQLGAIDSSQIDTLTITAIVGNDNNGGEDPDLIAECLFVKYKTPAMDRSQLLNVTPDITLGHGDGVIIATPLDGQDGRSVNNGGLNNYSITIPDYARAENTNFILYQNFNSGSEFDNYGITDIKFQRKTPINVVVSLDSPEAVSFVRVGGNEGDPKKRKKKVNDQLEASDQYTTKQMGKDFPGSGARLGDETDPFTPASIQEPDASPIGKDEVKKSFIDYKGNIEKQNAAEVEKLSGELDDLYNNPNATMDDFIGADNVERVETILKINPKNVEALYTRSLISSINGDQDAAIVDAEKAYEIDPNDAFSKSTLEYAYSSKISSTWDAAETMGELMNDKKLMDTIDKAIKLDPNNSINYWYRSQINESNENYEAVVEDLEKMLEIDPQDSATELRLGDIKQKQAEKLEREQKSEATEKKQEAKELLDKGIGDYYDDPGFEFEPEIEPLNIQNWDKNDSRDGILQLYKADYETAKATIANLPKQSETIGATYSAGNIDQNHLSIININIESRDVRFRSPESMSQEELQRNLISLSLEIEDQKYWVNDLSQKLGINVTGAPGYVLGGTKFTGEINGVTSKEVEAEYDTLQDMLRPPYKGDWRGQNSKVNKLADQLRADNEIRKLNAKQHQLVTQYNKLYNAFMGEGSDIIPLNLPETIQKFNDDEKLFDKLKTETKIEDGVLKKVLGRMLDVFKDKRDMMLAVKKWALVDMANAESYMENWAIQIGISMLTNTPIRIDESTISDTYKKSFARNITPGYFISEKTATNPDGIAIPIVEEEVLYADDNFYIDEKGNTVSNIGPNGEKAFYKKNTTMQVFSVNGTRTTNIFQASPTNPLQKDPLSTVGKMQFQVIYPKKGEPYLLVKDHAYWNMESNDPYEIGGEVNNLGDRVKNTMLTGFAYTAAALSAGSNLRWFGQENFGNMKGYPKNIRGDVVTRFEVPFNLLSPDVQEYINNNKPGAEIKTGAETDPFKDEIKPGLGAKDGDKVAMGGVNYDLYNYLLKTYDAKAANWYENNPTLPHGANPHIPAPEAPYVPLASVGGIDATTAATAAASTGRRKKNNKKTTTMVAHYKPKGKNLFEKIKKKSFFNKDDIKPTFPENPPPELDPKTGMHPNYGKQAGRYKKLDPTSANAMPPTGDPETDAIVDKQRTKPRPKIQSTSTKIKKLRKKN